MSEIPEQQAQLTTESLVAPGQTASFPIIGLGASAGGLQALKDFFTHMPDESGMAFVVIMHLSPKHESHAAELLQATTNMLVTQVTETVKVEPNHVYVISPTKNLEMLDGHIKLIDLQTLQGGRQVAIDLFFRTLGDTHKEKAVGIVLSGMGSDGTNGLKRIKEQNGLAFAQEPGEAEHDSMPQHAIDSGLVDFVLPVTQMPEKLVEIWGNVNRIKLPPITKPPVISQEDGDETALRDILKLLHSHTGHDFKHYKRATVLRRIKRRLQVNGLLDLTTYSHFMREHPMEAQALLKDLLISVTNFFRDRAAFEEFEREVVPLLFHEKSADDMVRVWVTGCATGEEAYSVAILLSEYAEKLTKPPAIHVFATDIDEAAIRTARAGSYADTIEADVSPERLRRFFMKEVSGYRVKKEMRERLLFASHNLIKDPPFSHLDAVTCRNLLIYLNREAQEHIFELFHFVLRPKGFLFLGNSESADSSSDLFATVDKKQRIYRAKSVTRASARVSGLPLTLSPGSGFVPQIKTTHKQQKISFGELHQKLLDQYTPPSVLIDADYDIVHLADRAGRFLQFADGEPSRNLLKVVDPALRVELRIALFQAAQTGKSIEARRVKINRDDRVFYVNMIARPVRESDGASGNKPSEYFLVVFDEVEGLTSAENGFTHTGETEPVMRLLEEELQRTKEGYQAIIDQFEMQTEELKASNEELQATNEELRSATEELETGKEELQSVNEETQTINSELKNKLDELAVANSDMQNLITSTDLATIFINRELKIKFYTPRAQGLFNLIPSDIGRSLSDITHKLDYKDMLHDVDRVLDDMQHIEREVASRDARFYIAQMKPYRTPANDASGVILTFLDFTARKLAEEALLEAKERLGLLVESAKDHAIYAMDARGQIDYWNAGAQALFGYTEDKIIGQSAALLFTAEDRERQELEREMREADERGSIEEERWYIRQDGSCFYASGVFSRLYNERLNEGTSHGYAVIARDLTARKRQEESLRELSRQFEQRVRDFSITLSFITDFAYIIDRDGHFMYANQPLLDVWGLKLEEVAGKSFVELHYPSDLALRLQQQIRQVFETGQVLRDETFYTTPNGVEGYYEYIFAPVKGSDGMVDVVVGSTRDYTERKRAEAALRESETRFRAAFEQANVGIVQASSEGRLQMVNPGFCKILGREEEELRGAMIRDITHPDDFLMEKNFTSQVWAGDISGFSLEKCFLHRNGSIIWGQMTASLVRRASGEPFYTLAIIEDITERKIAEEELKNINERLEGRVADRTVELSEMNAILQEEVRERQRIENERSHLLRRIVFAQEDERRRIAREMHDQFGQALTVLKLKLDALNEDCIEQPHLCEQLDALQKIAGQLDADVDHMVWEMRPIALDDLGLNVALSSYIENWSKHLGISVQLHTSGMEVGRLAPEIETTLYRVAQEALNNIATGARCTFHRFISKVLPGEERDGWSKHRKA